VKSVGYPFSNKQLYICEYVGIIIFNHSKPAAAAAARCFIS
jgi:hypothetical protein